MSNSIEQKAEIAQSRINTCIQKINPNEVYVAYSGGKDSAVVLDISYKVFKPTVIMNGWLEVQLEWEDKDNFLDAVRLMNTILPEKYPNARGVITTAPKANGIEIVKRLGFSRQIDGTRAAEHSRTGKSTSFVRNGCIINRKYLDNYFVKEGLSGLSMIYPIFDWTDEEVLEYVKVNGLRYV